MFQEFRLFQHCSNVQTNDLSLTLVSQVDWLVPTMTSAHMYSGSTSMQRLALNVGAPAFRFQDSRQTTSRWVSSDRAVLIQTDQEAVFNMETPWKSQWVHIVLDCGSQCSYITERLTKELSLTTRRSSRLQSWRLDPVANKLEFAGSRNLACSLKMDRHVP